MTSSDTPDTGAGTPLTAEEHLYGCAEAHSLDCPCKCHVRAHRERLITALVFAGADERPATEHEAERWLDAARPATDPAGLDALQAFTERLLALAQQDVSAHGGGEFAKGRRNAAEDVLNELRRVRRVAARLAVADGPGPERRKDDQ